MAESATPVRAFVGRFSSFARSEAFSFVVVLVVSAILVYRLFQATSQYSINLLFKDQLALYFLYAEKQTWWEYFSFQWGPPRLGLGGLIAWLIAQQTQWDVRAETFVVAMTQTASMILALMLKRRLFGKWSVTDSAIPLMFLTGAQLSAIISLPFLAHSHLPLLLILLYCFAWLTRNVWWRYALVAVLNFLLLFSGFGMLIGVITIGLMLFECLAHRKNTRRFLAALGGLVAAVLSVNLFLIGYERITAASCFVFPHPQSWKYPIFSSLMLSKFLEFRFAVNAEETRISLAIGMALLTTFLAAFFHHLARYVKSGAKSFCDLIPLLLLGFCLLYVSNAAIGRLCFGLYVSQAVRYSTLVTTGFLGLYFSLLQLPSATDLSDKAHNFTDLFRRPCIFRTIALAILLALLVSAHVFRSRFELVTLRDFSQAKRRWADCYLRTENVAHCNKETGFEIYWEGLEQPLQVKLDALKNNKLNLFAEK
jgi:hypothetical protein